MTRVANRFLMVCLLSLPAAAFADVYPLSPSPDLFINAITSSGGILNGRVETITDTGGCWAAPCDTSLRYWANGTSFKVYGTDLSDVYLAGRLVDSQVGQVGSGEYGEKYTVAPYDLSKWSALDDQFGLGFGPYVVIDYHNFNFSRDSLGYHNSNFSRDSNVAFADMTPTPPIPPVPEPMTLALSLTGMAVGLARRLATKKHSI